MTTTLNPPIAQIPIKSRVRWMVEDAVRPAIQFVDDQWFDRTRQIKTSGNVSLEASGLIDNVGDSEWHMPARPRHVRHALRKLPMGHNVSDYTFIDLGSGKGRSLFIAAELPFQRVIGVELSGMLYEQACANIRSFRHRKGGSSVLDALHMNATDFEFPNEENLVLYLFNPFGAETVSRVMTNLQRSLQQRPRHVVVLLLWPKCGQQVLQIPGMKMIHAIPRLQVFEVFGNKC